MACGDCVIERPRRVFAFRNGAVMIRKLFTTTITVASPLPRPRTSVIGAGYRQVPSGDCVEFRQTPCHGRGGYSSLTGTVGPHGRLYDFPVIHACPGTAGDIMVSGYPPSNFRVLSGRLRPHGRATARPKEQLGPERWSPRSNRAPGRPGGGASAIQVLRRSGADEGEPALRLACKLPANRGLEG